MFIEIEMKYLSDFPQDTYAEPRMMDDLPIALAPYKYTQLGAHPQNQKIVAYIDGDEELFGAAFVGKYTELVTLPSGYQQTCCNEFINGRTLTKACIVAWQYTVDEEMAIHRTMLGAIEETDEYSAYNAFVELIPNSSA